MKSKKPKLINGLIGISVLAMLSVAIIAGQARANQVEAIQTALELPQIPTITVIPSAGSSRLSRAGNE